MKVGLAIESAEQGLFFSPRFVLLQLQDSPALEVKVLIKEMLKQMLKFVMLCLLMIALREGFSVSHSHFLGMRDARTIA